MLIPARRSSGPFTATGPLLFSPDNTYDIGASGATRPRSIYPGTAVILPDGTKDLPVLRFTSALTSGLFFNEANGFAITCNGLKTAAFNSGAVNFILERDQTFGWTGTAGSVTVSAVDTKLFRAAAAVVGVTSNLSLGGGTVGTSGVGVLTLGNSTVPSTSPADTVQLFSTDISAGNASLGIRTETAVAVGAAVASTHTLSVTINGTVYKILLSNV